MWEFRFALAKSIVRRIAISSLFVRSHRWPQRKAAIDFPIVWFSGSRDFPELYVSIQSFLRFVGIPSSIQVVSDGSLDAAHEKILKDSFPKVHLHDWQQFQKNISDPHIVVFSQNHPLGKKLATIMYFNSIGPFLFSDSDILFFPGAAKLTPHLHSDCPRYLVDCLPAFDQRISLKKGKDLIPTNTGFLFFPKPILWNTVITTIPEFCFSQPAHHTEQTVIHLALQQIPSKPFPAKSFIVSLADQFRMKDECFSRSVVLRHYVQPVRHKFWNLPVLFFLRLFLKNDASL